MGEMALFMLLVIPLPFTVKRKIFTYDTPQYSLSQCWPLLIPVLCSFISENPLVAKLQYGLKITFIFILILFIDKR